jgi:tetratricopeptide (TPR) repeat protein
MLEPQSINVSVSPQEQRQAIHVKEEVDRALAYMQSKQPDPAILIFKRVLQDTDEGSAVHDVLTHNLLTAYKQRVEQLLKEPDVTPVNRYLPEIGALQLQGPLAEDPAFNGKFADTFKQLGMLFYEVRQHEAALFCFRKAIAIEPCPSYYVDLTNALAQTKRPAQLADYTTDYTPAQIGRHIFIACAPKTGSTFLKNTLVSLTGFKDVFSVYAGLQNEHDLDLPQLIKFGAINTVTQQHSRASEANIQMMQAFGIRPLILVRNIFDSAISLLDFYRVGFTFSTFFTKEEFLAFDQEQQVDSLIEYAIPWYFQFVASWQRVEREQRIEMLWLTYEEMIADKVAAIEKLLGFYGMSVARPDIQKHIAETESDKDKNRFNKGVAGRGRSRLTPQQIERIQRLARHFPSANFSCLGL